MERNEKPNKMISIVIPSLNEEKYLPALLASIEANGFSDKEIILADAGSTDKTLDIARQSNCKIVKGGLPAVGRNEGAKAAKGDIILFLDADVVVPQNFFVPALEEFKKRDLDIGSFRLTPASGSKMLGFFLDAFYNFPIVLLEKILPHAAMGILVKADFFKKTGGFDTEMRLSEDHYFARMARKKFNAKVGIVRSVKLFMSDRRFKTDGYFVTGMKYLFCEFYMVFIGPPKSKIFVYKFNHYNEDEHGRKREQ